VVKLKSLRTPDENFENLPDFPFKPHYINDLKGYEDLRLHYLDEGPKDSNQIFLCLHGQPTYSFLYRKMIPVFTNAGLRVIAPDFFGFGRSDKPVEEEVYTFNFHRNAILAFIEHLDLKNITLVCQDWGGLIGLTLPMDLPDRFSRLLVMNTMLSTGDFQLSKGFLEWRAWSKTRPDLAVGKLLGRTCPHLSEKERAAYDAPFPDITYKAGVRRFPVIVPDHPEMEGAQISQRARDYLSENWNGEVFMAVGVKDPVLGLPVMQNLRKIIHNCPKPLEFKDAGHFIQEWGEVVAIEALTAFKLI
jgi:pimeloyl-ACP methyl ester carboxylesterase